MNGRRFEGETFEGLVRRGCVLEGCAFYDCVFLRCTLENGLMYLTPMSNNGAYQTFTDVFRQTQAN